MLGACGEAGGAWASPLWAMPLASWESVQRAALQADLTSPVLAQEQAGLSPRGTVACATGSSPRGVYAASLAGRLGRAQTDHRQACQGSVSSSVISSTCWGWPSTRTQLCLSLCARTAMPSSTSATASSGPSCRESMSPRQASGSLAQGGRSLCHSSGGCSGAVPRHREGLVCERRGPQMAECIEPATGLEGSAYMCGQPALLAASSHSWPC